MSIKYPLTGAPSLTIDEVYNAMQTDAVKGISATESKKRSLQFGLNAPQLKHQQSTVSMLVEQFKSPIVYLLCVAAGISMYFQDTLAAISIMIVVVVNAIIGFFMELQARSSMRALRQMDVSFSKVIHGGKVSTIPSENIVPGDLLLLEPGDLVAADGRIVSCNHLQCDESAITGESFPVNKNKVQLSGSVTIADQLNMVFKGTSVVNGNAKFIVTGIGKETELGEITSMVANAKSLATPLEQKISHLTKKLIWITLGMTGLFFISGIIEGHSWLLVFETSIALAVAAFPEGLPIVATVALSYGMLLMARKNAIVKKLSAVETLGGVNVILTDKTGTLTENKIDVEQLSFPGEQLNIKIKKGVLTFNDGKNLEQKDSFERMVLIGILCNNAPMKQAAADEKAVGDPVEVALVVLAKATGLDIENTNKGYKRVGEFPFSSETKIMGTIHKNGDGFLVAAKGSVEDLLLKCSSLKQQGKVTNMNDLERKWNCNSKVETFYAASVLFFIIIFSI